MRSAISPKTSPLPSGMRRSGITTSAAPEAMKNTASPALALAHDELVRHGEAGPQQLLHAVRDAGRSSPANRSRRAMSWRGVEADVEARRRFGALRVLDAVR